MGVCFTFLTLPPFPWPSYCSSSRSSLRSSYFVSAFISRFASFCVKSLWRPGREAELRPVDGAELDLSALTVKRLSSEDITFDCVLGTSFMGGGLLRPLAWGGGRVATGSVVWTCTDGAVVVAGG